MSLSTWTQEQPGSSVAISLEINTPLVGNGSLKLANAGGSNGIANMYLTSLSKGFTKGRIRTLLRMVTRPTGVVWERAGLVCLQDGLDITSGSQDFYTFGWGVGSTTVGTPGTQRWSLRKHTNTTLAAVGTELDGEDVSVSASDYYPVQLEWNVDIADLGGTRLTCSVGTLNSTDFSTLAVLFDYLDTSSPFTTSVGEGLFIAHPSAGANVSLYTMDETTIYELV